MSLKIAPLSGVARTSRISLESKGAFQSHGRIVILIVGPFASGKDTIVKSLMQDGSLEIAKPVRYTTRQKRDKETNGIDYYFVSKETFEEMRDKGEFIQADDFGFYYGTSINSLQELFDKNKDVIFSLGCDDAEKLKIELTKNGANYIEIFISPMSKEDLNKPGGIDKGMEILEKRMRDRGRDSDYEIRTEKSRRWLGHVNNYQHVIENSNGRLETALDEIKKLMQSV